MALKKGDRVEIFFKGKTEYGVVVKAGDMAKVRLDGGERELKGPALYMKLSDHPLPKDKPSEMDRYSIRGYKSITGHGDSPCFEATILENGKPILYVENDGWGGCNFYSRCKNATTTGETRFHDAVKSWVAQFGYPDMMEPEDAWVDWWKFERPYGKLAEDMINSYKNI